ncbi:MAG: 50S ribosomal protein L15 [Kiritimatiellae bacterium]|nr:50S ribosomal protein L15 [Kiritimatiellia bacterium]
MDLHTLSNEPGARKSRKRRGRGRASGLGKTAGKGHKGQNARKGHKHKLGFEGGQMPLMRRLPKRGFKNPARTSYAVINLAALNRFADGEVVDAAKLVAAGLLPARAAAVKILGQGALERKLTVKAAAFSAAAASKIAAAGGSCAKP